MAALARPQDACNATFVSQERTGRGSLVIEHVAVVGGGGRRVSRCHLRADAGSHVDLGLERWE